MDCSRVIEICCYQFSDGHVNTPILPPDDQECLQRGSLRRIKYKNADEARNAYNIGMQMKTNLYSRRKYLRGGRYRNIFMECRYLLDVRDYGGMVDLNIKLSNGETSILKIRDLSIEVEAMEGVKEFSERSKKESEARCSAGDLGKMFAFGKHNKVSGDYVSMKNKPMHVRNYCLDSKKLLNKYFEDEVKQIIEADRKQGIIPSYLMGGENGISAYCLVSRDLVNAAHYDLDTSVGISIFNEKIVGMAKSWCFVLPNTIIDGGSDKEAIVIKLFDGCTISWDGRKVFHCTGTKEVGDGNHLYGNYWGGKVYK